MQKQKTTASRKVRDDEEAAEAVVAKAEVEKTQEKKCANGELCALAAGRCNWAATELASLLIFLSSRDVVSLSCASSWARFLLSRLEARNSALQMQSRVQAEAEPVCV